MSEYLIDAQAIEYRYFQALMMSMEAIPTIST